MEVTSEDLAHRTSESCRLAQRCYCQVAVMELPISRAKEIVGHRLEKVCRYAFAGSTKRHDSLSGRCRSPVAGTGDGSGNLIRDLAARTEDKGRLDEVA